MNGTRNGKRKDYYYKVKLEFEGEFLNGKKNRNGKEFYEDGKLKFEGKYRYDNKREGKGYDKNNNIIYELKEGKGFIKEYNNYNGELEFEG